VFGIFPERVCLNSGEFLFRGYKSFSPVRVLKILKGGFPGATRRKAPRPYFGKKIPGFGKGLYPLASF